MSLVEEIISLATAADTSVSTLLRKCLVLAARLDNSALRTWANAELNGYGPDDVVPEYRKTSVVAFGCFQGGFGSIDNRPLPAALLKERDRDWARVHYFRTPIAVYEELIKRHNGGNFELAWPGDLVAIYQRKFIEGYALVGAWQSIPVAGVIAVTDTIKTRVLNFALEISAAIEDQGEQNLSSLPKDKVAQSVTNNIFGGNVLFAATAQGIVQAGSITVETGDLNGLIQSLSSLGLKGEAIEELKAAVLEDGVGRSGPGPKTSGWLAKTLANVGKAGLTVGVDVARTVVTKAVMGYLGVDPS